MIAADTVARRIHESKFTSAEKFCALGFCGPAQTEERFLDSPGMPVENNETARSKKTKRHKKKATNSSMSNKNGRRRLWSAPPLVRENVTQTETSYASSRLIRLRS
jgi:hypothetical protein